MKNRKRKILLILLIILAIGVIYSAIWMRGILLETRQLASLAEESRTFLKSDIKLEDIPKAVDLAGKISISVDELKSEIDPILPIIQILEQVPKYGSFFGNLEHGLGFLSNLSKAAVVLGRTGLLVFDGEALETGLKLPQAINDFLMDNQRNFLVAEEFIRKAEASKERIDFQYIPARYYEEFLSIENYLSKSPILFSGLKSLPGLLGEENPATYLIMVQNRDEIRATGGFITAFGLLQLKEGRLLALKIDDSTKYDYVEEIRDPPYPMKEIMFAHYLVARDANWSPDFPTAALQTQEIYKLSTGIETEGVIAFDQQFIADFLDFFGPISLPEDEETIHSGNVESKMIEYKQTAVDEGNLQERKEFLSLLTPYLLKNALETLDLETLIESTKFLRDEIQKGHLFFFFNNPEVQQILYQFELDGSVRPGENDFIMLVDSNIGIGKIDLFINRSLRYQVNLEDYKKPIADIKMRYVHTQEGSDPCLQGRIREKNIINRGNYYFSRCYWDYWRVLTTKDTEITKVFLNPIPDEYFREGVEWDQEPVIGEGENGTTMVGGLTVVPQKSEQEVHIETALPATVVYKNEDGGLVYALRIQKQAGLNYLPVEIIVTPPQGYSIDNVPANWIFDVDENMVIWKGEIDRTTDFSLEFSLDQ